MGPLRTNRWRGIALTALLLWPSAAWAQPNEPEITHPVAIHQPPAVYPEGIEIAAHADVVLTVTIDAEGRVADVAVASSGTKPFDDAATEAVLHWTFTPATRNGKPVAAKITVPFHFAAPIPVNVPVPVPAPVPAPAPAPTAPPPTDVNVHGHAEFPTRGGGDYNLPVGLLRSVPRPDAASILRLAPGVVLQNEGGSGHPQQILMRGFDAREGQDIEFTVDGIPLNEVGNPHGDGLTDLHLLLPELVSRVRVLQGPFAPQQGNYAVAGSVHFDLGVQDPGLTLSSTVGSFGTRRMLAMWRPGKNERTFAAAELGASDGFGPNRDSVRGTAIAGYEVPVGNTGSVRFLSLAYSTQYKQPGPLRADDVAAGRVGFFDTYDPTQGGSSSRFLFGATFTDKLGATQVSQSAFAGYRDFRVRANETGLLEDPRGDLLDQHAGTWTFGARGSARQSKTVFGLKQELELGYFARVDRIDSLVERDLFRTTTPFQTDSDLASTLSNVGVYADASLKPFRWLTLRGGVRGEFFGFDVRDRLPSATSATGETRSIAAGLLEPRASLLVGPFCGFSFNVSAGVGARSLGPEDVLALQGAPYAKATGYEGGVSYHRPLGAVELNVRSVFFATHVDHDLIFSEVEGRNVAGGGTTRAGWTGSARATGRFFDLGGSVAVVRATFDDTGDPLLYVPPVSVRVDGALFADSPFRVMRSRITGTLGLGATYVAPRPLPNGDAADAYGLVDLGGSLKWKVFTLGVRLTNLFGAEYKLNEFNYASNFGTQPASSAPVRHFVAGEPRGVFATLSVNFGP